MTLLEDIDRWALLKVNHLYDSILTDLVPRNVGVFLFSFFFIMESHKYLYLFNLKLSEQFLLLLQVSL